MEFTCNIWCRVLFVKFRREAIAAFSRSYLKIKNINKKKKYNNSKKIENIITVILIIKKVHYN